MRGDVYAHTDKHCLSIVDRETESKTYGEVVDHCKAVLVRRATVKTYENRRVESVETGVKNVHAMWRGIVTCVEEIEQLGTKIEYDVEMEGCFHVDGERVVGAETVEIATTEDGFEMYGWGIERMMDTKTSL